MITFPCAKINLGLNIVSRREDGYHNLETVFYPIPLYDALEIHKMDDRSPSDTGCDLKLSGASLVGREEDNLVVRAYHLLANDFKLPRIHIHLHKHIPSQAGLGGGSSDAAFMIRLLDERFRLNIGDAEMERYAARLGADCAFFIRSEVAYATGIGDILEPADTESGNLNGKWLAVVKPDIPVSTAEAFSRVKPCKPAYCCRDIVRQPIHTWRDRLKNDFEDSVFALYPEIGDIKQKLYDMGAAYAQMSGSGSAVFGIFESEPEGIAEEFGNMFNETMKL